MSHRFSQRRACRTALALAVAATAFFGIDEMTPVAGNPGPASFELMTGERFGVSLPSNRSTGYQWQLGRALDERVVKLVGSEYRAPDRGKPGAGGSEIWVFDAAGAGEASVVLHYARPWNKGAAPARTNTFTLLVR